ncbi:MAG: phosphopantothenoylcysteine decarboxylase, partial [Candidatus Thorarchaeota archaeon]
KRPSGESYSIKLEPTVKIIDMVRKEHPDLFIVGFKVESGVTDPELEERARVKVTSGICNLVVANDAYRKGVAFGTDTNEVIIVGTDDYSLKIPLSPKRDIARGIVDTILLRMR